MEEEMMTNTQPMPGGTEEPTADTAEIAGGFTNQGDEVERTENQPIDVFSSPTPGESLTKSPDEKFPWESPAEFTSVQPFMEELFLQLTDEEAYIELLGLLMRKTPVDDLTQVLLYKAMSSGKINPDLLLLLIEPVMYLIIAIAENSDIEPVIYEGEDFDEMDEESAQMYVDKSKEMKDMRPEKIRKSSVEPSLLAKVEDLPTAGDLDVSVENEPQEEQEEV
jgi:hypothetical protein|tara:strand:- start:204 stop:869 length:666 start_codon:yes stop_codon:yes gene_type:complete